jgi:hypothetical protein
MCRRLGFQHAAIASHLLWQLRMDSGIGMINIDMPKLRSQTMSTPNEQAREAGGAASKASLRWRFALASIAALLGIGILLRLAGVPVPAWVLVATGAALAFVFILPAFGGRMHEPEDSPFKKAPWGF